MDTINPLITPSATKFVFGVSYQETVANEASDHCQDGCWRALPDGLISSVGLTKCHQVVAISYSASPTKQIGIYDCNHSDTAVSLTLNDAVQVVNESTGESWVGFFLLEYSAGTADYLDIVMSAPLTTNLSPPRVANPAEVGFPSKTRGSSQGISLPLMFTLVGPMATIWIRCLSTTAAPALLRPPRYGITTLRPTALERPAAATHSLPITRQCRGTGSMSPVTGDRPVRLMYSSSADRLHRDMESHAFVGGGVCWSRPLLMP